MADKLVTLVTVKVDGTTTEKQVNINDLRAFQEAVGGYIEVVQLLEMFDHGGVIRKCIALCDEEGKLKGKPINVEATKKWYRNVEGKVGIPAHRMNDFLVGDIAFVFGDPKIMAQF
ncbi:DUF3846 domain-containing protein [Mesorhizobium sp. M8A.F.Ca.ET.021.01.1.1]|uniref:DUF3846 domain-containing protein n=1 Tax=Mesorhizobium sp. M8A.F.Ca.ET.021.01.1.1 TaxID=2496757 RepID=UPI000FCA62D8|nr:DUF3846 domain-containing protein [Mesorhizobium sp. M8A.F.Ca.ET.021.01.1.1]RUW56826.1 DUF3846 domain-containing protein [Mesorhizobium sp. M8A.F.Ca.ET.021.01.1.1]